MTVRSAIQIALEHRRRYGYRRITAELRQRGMLVNHKRVARIMRMDNLLTIRHGELTRGSRAERRRGNLSQPRKPIEDRRTKPGVRCGYYVLHSAKDRICLSAVVLDAFSRKVVGWSLDRTLQSRLPLGALKQAILDSVQGILFCSLDCGSASSFTHRQNPFQ